MSRNTLNKQLDGINREHTKRRVGNLYAIDSEVPYSVAWQWQQKLVCNYKKDICKKDIRQAKNTGSIDTESIDTGSMDNELTAISPQRAPVAVSKDSLLLLEHSPVYTLGQGADTQFLRFDPAERPDIELYRVERGGEVTHHCPGQLVGYPILNLRYYQQDLHWYLRALEEVIIRTLAHYGLSGERIEGLTGVWLNGYKVAAIGIKVSRWITMHGFALNVCPDLAGFSEIVPCGLKGKKVGSLAMFLPEIRVGEVRTVVVEQFEQVFGISLVAVPQSDLQRADLQRA